MVMPLKTKIHAIAPELQFWGYEGGNVLAAVARAGGFIAFYNALRSVGDVPLHDLSAGIVGALMSYPDVLVTTGLALIVLLAVTLGGLFDTTLGSTESQPPVPNEPGFLETWWADASGWWRGARKFRFEFDGWRRIVDASGPDRAHRYLCDLRQSDDLSGRHLRM